MRGGVNKNCDEKRDVLTNLHYNKSNPRSILKNPVIMSIRRVAYRIVMQQGFWKLMQQVMI